MAQSNPATQFIINQQEQVRQSLPSDNTADFENAKKGFIGRLDLNIIKNNKDDIIWNNYSYKFLESDPPDTANPSRWR